jgi:hypothetical protein
MRRTHHLLIAATIAAMTSGCYSYTTIPIATSPEPGTMLRAELTATGTETLAPLIGAETRAIEGRLTSAGDQSLRLAVRQTETRRGAFIPWQGESVEIPKPLVADLRVRTLSRTRTMLFTGGLIVAAVGLGAGLGAFDGGPDRGGRGPLPPPR